MRLFIILLLTCASLSAQTGLLHKYSKLDASHCGVVIKRLNGERVYSYQSDKSFTPASVTKLITTATALELLSADYCYSTDVLYSGTLSGGVLNGDIIIRGSGDPTLGSKHFFSHPEYFLEQWAADVKKAGICSVNGAIVVDASVFDKRVVPDKWIWEDIGNYYGAACYGVSGFDNSYELTFGPTAIGDTAQVSSISPNIPGLHVYSAVTGADIKYDNAYIYGDPWHFTKQVYGQIPANRDRFTIKGAMPNPPYVLGYMLRDCLIANNIRVKGYPTIEWEGIEASYQLIGSVKSPRLETIIGITNKKSNNLCAEHLLKTLDVGEGHSASLNSALGEVLVFWQEQGVSTVGVKLYDGSGLSRANLMTPDFVTDVLLHMLKSDNAEVYKGSLSTSGVDGTLKYFMHNTLWKGKVKGKSGSMSGVRCYAGAVEVNKEVFAFSIMVNNFTCSSGDIKKQVELYLNDLFNIYLL